MNKNARKLHIQIHQHKFELVSNGAAEDALIKAAAGQLAGQIAKIRRDDGIPDNARATMLAALRLTLGNTSRDNAARAEAQAADNAIILSLSERIQGALSRTDDPPAEVLL